MSCDLPVRNRKKGNWNWREGDSVIEGSNKNNGIKGLKLKWRWEGRKEDQKFEIVADTIMGNRKVSM